MVAVTQSRIALELGVSQSTVKAVFNPDPRIRLRPATRQRVLETAERLGYRPHRHAQLMRGKKSGVIGMIKPTHSIQSATERSFHAAKAIYEAGYGLTANEILWSDKGFKLGVDAMLDAHVEAVLLVGITGEESEEDLGRLRKANIPMVSLAGNQHPGIPYVAADHQQGMMDVTSHVLGLGHRNVALVTTVTEAEEKIGSKWVLRERLMGFKQAVAGRLRDTEWRVIRQPIEDTSFDSFMPGKLAMQQVLASGDHPRAMIFSNDYMAIGAMAICAEKGVSIPKDVAVTGFDDSTVGQHTWPPLTTVAQPNEAVARKSVEILLKKLRGEELSADEYTIKVPCRLVVRQSCGAGNQI